MARGLKVNPKKSETMVFRGAYSISYLTTYIPSILFNNSQLKVVEKFKYLGHNLTSDLNDDRNIVRKRRVLTGPSKKVAHRFARCSYEGKITLIKYIKRVNSALRVQYDNAFRVLTGLPSRCNASGMFVEARMDRFQTIMWEKIVSLLSHVRQSPNSILYAIVERNDCSILKYWILQTKGVAQY